MVQSPFHLHRFFLLALGAFRLFHPLRHTLAFLTNRHLFFYCHNLSLFLLISLLSILLLVSLLLPPSLLLPLSLLLPPSLLCLFPLFPLSFLLGEELRFKRERLSVAGLDALHEDSPRVGQDPVESLEAVLTQAGAPQLLADVRHLGVKGVVLLQQNSENCSFQPPFPSHTLKLIWQQVCKDLLIISIILMWHLPGFTPSFCIPPPPPHFLLNHFGDFTPGKFQMTQSLC